MNSVLTYFQRESVALTIGVIASLLLSCFITLQQDIINPDAICYLMSAETIGKKGISEGMQLCGQAAWPFYAWIIAQLVHIVPISYSSAAYLINGVFSAMTVLFFVLIIRELGGSVKTLWFAALTILLAHEFNSVREYIVRDHGFWAFYLFSIWLLLKFFRTTSWGWGIAWNISLIVATLFRIEGAIFLVTLPWLSLFYNHFTLSQRFKLFIRLSSITGLVVSTGLLLFIFKGNHDLQWGRLHDFLYQAQHGVLNIINQYHAAKLQLAMHVISHESMMNVDAILLVLLLGWYGISVITNLSWIYSLLVVYAWRYRIVYFPFSSRLVLAGYIGVNIIITACFLAENLFLSKRYLIALSLALMVWVPFVLEYFYVRIYKLRYRLILPVTMICIVCSALGGIFEFGYSKQYILQAGQWLQANVAQADKLYANDYQLRYYSHHFGENVFPKRLVDLDALTIPANEWKQYDYIALRINKRDKKRYVPLLNHFAFSKVASFNNKRGDAVLIFKTKHKAS